MVVDVVSSSLGLVEAFPGVLLISIPPADALISVSMTVDPPRLPLTIKLIALAAEAPAEIGPAIVLVALFPTTVHVGSETVKPAGIVVSKIILFAESDQMLLIVIVLVIVFQIAKFV